MNATEEIKFATMAHNGWELDSAVERHQAAPNAFEIPSEIERHNLRRGDVVKLLFLYRIENGVGCERMWVRVKNRANGTYIGKLNNAPLEVPLNHGDEVAFCPQHVCAIFERHDQ